MADVLADVPGGSTKGKRAARLRGLAKVDPRGTQAREGVLGGILKAEVMLRPLEP